MNTDIAEIEQAAPALAQSHKAQAAPATPAAPRKPALVAALKPEDQAKLKAFADAKVKHPKLNAVIQELVALLTGHTESNIILITGAPGVGKTALSRTLSRMCQELFQLILEDDPSAIPAIRVEAYADGERKAGFKALYQSMLGELLEPGADKKHEVEVKDGRLSLRAQNRMTISALRQAVESSLRQRKTLVCAIDEAYHLLRFSDESAVMDTLKSLSNTTGAKFVIIGSFDLFDMVAEHAQVARRAVVLNFDRYHIDDADDRSAFADVVWKLQTKWPCAQVPNFRPVSSELMEASLGCVGLLKSLMLDAAALQMANKGVWSGQFLAKAAKSTRLSEVIRKEIEAGEAKVRNALMGECLWSEAKLAEMEARMEAADA
jgi:nucleoside-triphosphatase THEP1